MHKCLEGYWHSVTGGISFATKVFTGNLDITYGKQSSGTQGTLPSLWARLL